MSSITSTDTSQSTQAVTTTTGTSTTTPKSTSSGDFSTMLNALLVPDKEKSVSEEALFAALTVDRVTKLKGADAGKQYQDLLTQTEKTMTTGNGYVPYESAAYAALNKFKATGALTADEADKVNTEAFSAAQLDGNTNCLYDNIGGAGDPTKAVALVADAISKAKTAMDQIDAGTATLVTRALASAISASGSPISNPYDQGGLGTNMLAATVGGSGTVPNGSFTPTGTKIDGQNGFLFKPKSDHGGKLCLLLPVTSSVDIVSAVLKDANGNVIENGARPLTPHVPEPGDPPPGANTRTKVNFSKPGGSYPKNVTVEVKYTDGSIATYSIPDPSKRYD